jgi:hypothetical protein
MQMHNDRLVLIVDRQFPADALLMSRGLRAAWSSPFTVHHSLFTQS